MRTKTASQHNNARLSFARKLLQQNIEPVHDIKIHTTYKSTSPTKLVTLNIWGVHAISFAQTVVSAI